MRFIVLLALCASPAFAGPPEFAHYDWRSFAVIDDALWLVGDANCDEGGMRPAAYRIDTGDFVIDRAKVAELAKHAIASNRWVTGDDVYETGTPARVSHDRGKTWRKLVDLELVAGRGDAVYAVSWWRVMV